MKPVISLIILSLLLSCSKNSIIIEPQSGIWIEQSLRLDTLDFDFGNTFGTVDNNKTVFLRTNPGFNSNIYSYYFKSDTLFIRSFLSSSSLFESYKFQMAVNHKAFEVAKFYNRNGLPATLTFEKIK